MSSIAMKACWICLPLAVLSLTGVYISFPQTSRALFGVAQPQPAGGGGRFAPPLAQPKTTLDGAVAAATAAMPGAQVVSVQVPTRGGDPAWRIQMKDPDGSSPTTLPVADATGEVKPPRAGGGGGGPDPLSRWMRRIHDGADTSVVWQTVIFLGGAAPAVLAITGLVMWLRRRARRIAISRA